MITIILFTPMLPNEFQRDHSKFTLIFTRGEVNHTSELLVAKNDLSGSTKMNVMNVVINSLNRIEHRLWEETPLTKGEKDFVFHVVAEAERKLMVSDVMEFVHSNKMFESIVDKDGYTSFVITSEER